ncbi:hypothetical protein ACWD3J_48705 [Streptomyces sp. NPDC002755]
MSVHADDQVGEGVPAKLAAFLRDAVDGRPVKIAPSIWEGCGGRVFFVLVNASGAERECSGCGSRAFIADSEEYWNEEFWEDDEPGAAGCPCGSEEFETAVAFSLADDGSVRWVTLGLQCIKDEFSGVYADWKIDYGPTDHLLTMERLLHQWRAIALGRVRDDEAVRVPWGLIRLAMPRRDPDLHTLTSDDVEGMRHAVRHCERIPGLLQVVDEERCPTLKAAWGTTAYRTGGPIASGAQQAVLEFVRRRRVGTEQRHDPQEPPASTHSPIGCSTDRSKTMSPSGLPSVRTRVSVPMPSSGWFGMNARTFLCPGPSDKTWTSPHRQRGPRSSRSAPSRRHRCADAAPIRRERHRSRQAMR